MAVSFKAKGIAIDFPSPPSWILVNSAGKTLLSGTASPDGTKWKAIFTVSKSYIVPNGSEQLTVEFNGLSAKGREYTTNVDITLEDLADAFSPYGIVYSLISSSKLIDTVFTDTEEIFHIKYKIYGANETILDTLEFSNLAYNTKTRKGYQYNLDLGRPDLAAGLIASSALLGILEITTEDLADPITEVHPIYVVNAKIAGYCNTLKQYLDKAQLREIDPSLQFHMAEFVHHLIEGARYLNSLPGTLTYWTVDDCPMQLSQYMIYAAAHSLLNARYMAEGFNAFNFTGANTSLEFDRRDTISYKIDELGNLLAGALNAKTTAIKAGVSPGTNTDPNSAGSRAAVGVLGLTINPMTNRVNRFGSHTRSRLLF